jgi:hypothetical protein
MLQNAFRMPLTGSWVNLIHNSNQYLLGC